MPVLTGPGAELITFEGTNHPYDATNRNRSRSTGATLSTLYHAGQRWLETGMYRWGFGAATVFNRDGFLQFHNPINQIPTKKKAAKRGLEKYITRLWRALPPPF